MLYLDNINNAIKAKNRFLLLGKTKQLEYDSDEQLWSHLWDAQWFKQLKQFEKL